MDIPPTTWATLVTVAAGCAIFWSKIVMVFQKLQSFVFAEALIRGEASTAVQLYCWKNGRKSFLQKRTYKGKDRYLGSLNRSVTIVWEDLNTDPAIFWMNKWPLIVFLSSPNDEKSGGNFTRLICFRGTIDVEQFIIDSVKCFNDLKYGDILKFNKTYRRHTIYTERGRNGVETAPRNAGGSDSKAESVDDIWALKMGRGRLLNCEADDIDKTEFKDHDPFKIYHFPAHVREAITEIGHWLKHREWFMNKGLKWQRGWNLYGPPGTGKTSLALAIAISLDLPIYFFDLATMSNGEFANAWDRAKNCTPCIILLEDIDKVFEGSVNVYAKKAGNGMSYLTFDCLLNCIAGVKRSDGVFTIVTTNHIDKLDPALGVPGEDGRSTRPGRLDRMLYLGVMEQECRQKVAERVLCDWPEVIPAAVEEGDGMVAADFEDLVAKKAHKLFWVDAEQEGIK